MLQQLFHTTIVSFICILWGLFFLLSITKSVFKDNFWFHSFPSFLSFLFFSGCVVLGSLSTWLCLLLPLKFYYLLSASCLLFLYMVFFQSKKISALFREFKKEKTKYHFTEVTYIIVALILFLALGSMKPINFDTQIYHLQIIRWQSEYGTVPGIANLFPRFGQGSNWFDIISIFNIPLSENENFAYANISFVAWFFIWLFSKWKYYNSQISNDNNASKTLAFFYFFLFIYFMLDWQLFRDAANSTNYDFQVTSFIIIIFSYLIEEIVLNKNRQYFSPVLILFAFTVVSFKFSGIFILLLVLYYLVVYRSFKNWAFVFTAGIIILIPVLARNYITTGYILFPHPLKINSPDWQLPTELTVGNYWYILNYNRFFNFWWMINYAGTGIFNRVPYWIKGILIQHKVIILLALSSGIWVFRKTPFTSNRKKLTLLIIIFLLMIAGWFLTAPDPGRFGYGVLLAAATLSLSFAVGKFFLPKMYRIAIIAATLILCVYIIRKTGPLFSNSRYLVYPMTTEKPGYKTKMIKGIPFNLPEILKQNWDHRCYCTPLPCICNENPYIQPRGNSLKDGFRMFPHPDTSFINHYEY